MKNCRDKIYSVDKNLADLNDKLPRIVSEQVSIIIENKMEEEKHEANVLFFRILKIDDNSKAKDIEFIVYVVSP